MNLPTGKKSAIAYGVAPRANLLPPEVRSADRARSTRQMLGIAAVFVVVVVVGAYGASAFRASQAELGLLASQQRAVALTKEQAKYTEATTLGDLVKTVTRARSYSVSSEIMWNNYFNAISAALPKGVVLTAATLAGHTPWAVPAAAPSGLSRPSVASIAFIVASKSVLDQTALTRSLSTLTGFAGSSIDSVTLVSGVYAANITVSFSSAALSGRFPVIAAATTAAVTK